MLFIRKYLPFLILLGVVLAVWFGLASLPTDGPWVAFTDRLAAFTTVFLGIFMEAAPFLLLGTLASGVVEVFISQDDMARLAPKNPLQGAVVGGLLGLFFPVCECGVVPFTRRLFRKGLPLSVGISFLLAAPVLNPIVILSTYAAYGWSPVLWLRIGLSLAIAIITGMIFALEPNPARLVRPVTLPSLSNIGYGGGGDDRAPKLPPITAAPLTVTPPSLTQRLRSVFIIAADEFFEMGFYLVLGAALAALMQTVVPQSWLISLGQNAFLSVVIMMAIGVLLSICSTVDAFVALAFVNVFPTGSILAFLVFGPMVDIKSVLMYLRVFNLRTVLYLVALPALMTLLAGLFLNFNVPF